MSNELLTSAAAARLLGVGPTTVKRWADAGLIGCVKTAGRHRRFPRAEVERLMSSREPPTEDQSSPPEIEVRVESWIRLLCSEASPHRLQAELLAERARAQSFWEVADSFAPVLRTLGDLWARGKLTVLQEHLASERLARTLAAASQTLPVPRDARHALLSVPEGEEHTLGLSLAELVFRESGWTVLWAGRRTPLSELTVKTRAGGVEALALSASAYSVSRPELAAQAEIAAEACRERRIPLFLGGEGEWPGGLRGVHRVRTFAELSWALSTLPL